MSAATHRNRGLCCFDIDAEPQQRGIVLNSWPISGKDFEWCLVGFYSLKKSSAEDSNLE
jgi:hypothetical protein